MKILSTHYTVLSVLILAGPTLAADYSTIKRQADQFYDTGRYQEAQEMYLRAQTLNNQDPDLYRRLGQIELKQANTEKAIQLFKQSEALDRTNPEMHYLLGTAYFIEGHHQQAIPEFQETIRLQPHHVWAIEYLASAYARTGQREEAIRWSQTLAELDPENRFVHTTLGNLYAEASNYEQAKVEFEKAVTAHPTYAENYAWLASTESRLGYFEEAIKHAQRAVELNPVDLQYQMILVQLYFQQGNYEQVVEVLTKALKLAPDNRMFKEYKQAAEEMLKRQASQVNTLEAEVAKLEHTLQSNLTDGQGSDLLPLDYDRWASLSSTLQALSALYAAANQFDRGRAFYQKLLERFPELSEMRHVLVEKELSKLIQWQEVAKTVTNVWSSAPETQTKYFVVKTNLSKVQKELLLDDVDRLFERAMSTLQEISGVPQEEPFDKIRLSVFAKADEYARYLATVTTEYFGTAVRNDGNFFAKRNEILLLFKPTASKTYFKYHQMGHELAHTAIYRLIGHRIDDRTPVWLDEGLAEYITEELAKQDAQKQAQEAHMKSNSPMSLQQLIKVQRRGEADALFLDSARLLVEFLIHRQPSEAGGGLKAYIHSLKDGNDSTSTFQNVFGDLQTLESEWKASN